MKKMVTIMFAMLVSIVTFAGKTKDPYHFVVEGTFLAEKNINYTIFEEGAGGEFVAIEHVKARKYYHVECSVGHKYIIRFQNKKGDVKFLMIDAVKYGYFMADVDWSKPNDGKITLEKVGYRLTPFTNMSKPISVAKN